MNIREIHENKKRFLPLLLLADEQEDMIDRYLERGTMYVLEDGGVKAECVITDEDGGILELKNLAVEPEAQRKGYGKALIDFLVRKYADLPAPTASQTSSPIAMTILSTRPGCSWWIWCTCKETYDSDRQFCPSRIVTFVESSKTTRYFRVFWYCCCYKISAVLSETGGITKWQVSENAETVICLSSRWVTRPTDGGAIRSRKRSSRPRVLPQSRRKNGFRSRRCCSR